ncbi:guanylyl cyclase-activating protein 1-like [Latimeria chalumnae]|uniref:guanylyl cyclase-activating protein 1-like n=1 Tax=Latimeria chalumnae TaxID=7897 RepID=UPI0003C12EEB|nr:PREDICTED: guanylyl cyclase-activating protein 1-like [Latimeria chalumnae]|eukprot:XP_005993675.1 PREDICTED: guanylyl cyclase-activating protein 1-like [Latimeria chalumnae]
MGASGSSVDDSGATDKYYWHKKFMSRCPSGQLSLHEFKALLDLHSMNDEANQYVQQVFNMFDLNKDGFIDFTEYIAAISLVLRGRLDQKLKWCFKLYDANENGRIDKKEFLSIIKAIHAINCNSGMNPEEFTVKVFDKVNKNGDGELSLEEFIQGAESDQSFMDMITKILDLSNILKIIQNGRRQSL